MLSPEEKQVIASLVALVSELQAMDEGAAETTVEVESPVETDPDKYQGGCGVRKEKSGDGDMEGTPEDLSDDDEEVYREKPDEVATNPAEERIEDDEADKVDAAVMKALSKILGVKKSAPVRKKTAVEELSSVMKSLISEVKNNKLVLNDLLEGIGVSNQIKKSIDDTRASRVPYAQSAQSHDATLDFLAKSIAAAKGTDTVHKNEQGDVRKSLSSVLPAIFGQR